MSAISDKKAEIALMEYVAPMQDVDRDSRQAWQMARMKELAK